MKVLFISHHREATGFGEANRRLILAMDSVGIDVVPRPIMLGNATNHIEDRIKELENKSDKNCDVCIQYVLPHHMEYNGKFKKCIGVFMSEHNGLKYTSWPSYLNLMDEIWVHSEENKTYARYNGINKPVDVVPIPCDINELEQEYEPLPIQGLDGNFIFYFIGEIHRRKHIASIIRAFHSEFATYEPISLLLKLNKFNASEQDIITETQQMCNMIKQGSRTYKDINLQKKEIIIANKLSRIDILRLHNTCQCYVGTSFGESWYIPVFEAMAFGNMPITTQCGGMQDYIVDGTNGFLVQAYQEPIIGVDQKDTFTGIHTSREWWWNVDSQQLKDAMRFVYQNYNKLKQRSSGLETARQYSYENIGNTIKGLIEKDKVDTPSKKSTFYIDRSNIHSYTQHLKVGNNQKCLAQLIWY